MSPRVHVLAGCLALLAASTAAAAGPRCPQLVDPRGDHQPPSDPAADLLSVRLSSDARALEVTVGYAGEHATAVPAAGHTYVVALGAGEGTLLAWADVAQTDTTFTLYRGAASSEGASAGTALGPIAGRVDTKAHTVEMVVPYAMAPDLLRRGAPVEASAVVSTSVISPEIPVTGHFFATQESDVSDRSTTYRLGTRGC